jgi:hypothetical protein
VRLVSGITLDPSASITQTFGMLFVFTLSEPSSALFDVKAIFVPSGDHCGSKEIVAAVMVVRGTGLEPSASITHMLTVLFVFAASEPSSARDDAKAIFVPSGDQNA